MSTQEQDKIYQQRLTPLQYRVTREGGTEQAFTGLYWNTKDEGSYDCICCGTTLFVSDDKYDSRSGWPSFTHATRAGRAPPTSWPSRLPRNPCWSARWSYQPRRRGARRLVAVIRRTMRRSCT